MDNRLAFKTDSANQKANLSLNENLVDQIWMPDTFIPNSKLIRTQQSTTFKQTNTFLRISSNGEVFHSTRFDWIHRIQNSLLIS